VVSWILHMQLNIRFCKNHNKAKRFIKVKNSKLINHESSMIHGKIQLLAFLCFTSPWKAHISHAYGPMPSIFLWHKPPCYFLMSATKSYTPCFYPKYIMNHGSISFTKHMLQFATYQIMLLFSFRMIHTLSLISFMAFIRITQDASIHNNVVRPSWFLFVSGKATKSTCWHNEKLVLVHMLTIKSLGYKRFPTFSKLANVPTPY
jgi:hypothetical protein